MTTAKAASGLAGLLLTGGASRRLGRAKAGLVLNGESLLVRQHRLLASVAKPVYRSVAHGTPPQPDDLVDPEPSPGPLPGILAALSAMPGPWLLVLAVDTPGLTRAAVSTLYRARVPGGVVMPRAGGEAEPLAAIWHRDAAAAIADALRRGERSVRAVLAHVPTRIIDDVDGVPFSLVNLNTDRDVERYARLSSRRWLQVAGYSGVGKTALLSHLLTLLREAGESASVLKVTHHPVQVQAGADTGRLAAAGAAGTWLLGPDGLFREGAWAPAVLAALGEEAWLLVEGGRGWPTPKVIVGQDVWPEHAGPVLGSIGANPALSARHLPADMPHEAPRAARWLFTERFDLSVRWSEVSGGPDAD